MLTDEKRAQRFLDLTGLTPEQLRGRIEAPEVQLSVLEFLCAHEPDLLGAAEARETLKALQALETAK